MIRAYKIVLMVLFMGLCPQLLKSQTTTKTGNGPWSNAVSWDNGVPTSALIAIISASNTTVNSPVECLSLEISASNQLRIQDTLTVHGKTNLESGVDFEFGNNGVFVAKGNMSVLATRVLEVNGSLEFASSFNIGQ